MKPQIALAPARKELALKPLSLKSFWDEVHRIQEQIEQRAYALFELRGRENGRDLDDWLKAEQEFLEPVPVDITEQDKALNIRAKVPGFSASELKINLEPWTLTITGTHEQKTEKQGQKSKVHEWRRKKICRIISLPAAIVPEKATATLNENMLEVKAEKAKPAASIEVTAA